MKDSSSVKNPEWLILREAAERKAKEQLDKLKQPHRGNPETLSQELQVHQIELELQNEELRQAQNQLEFTRQQYIDLYNLAPVGYASLDDSGLIWRANATLSNLLGIDPEEIIGRALIDFMEEEDRGQFLGRFTAFARKPEDKHIDVRFCVSTADGTKKCFTGRIQGRRIASMPPRYGLKVRKQETLLVIISDVTELKLSEERIEYQAFHDILTGLPNRANLQERLNMALAQARRNESFGTLLFMDLDRFKNVNDSLGHQVGDELLIQFALRLRKALRQEDLLVRMGGDEFVILLADQINDRGQAALNGQRLAKHLTEILDRPLPIGEHRIKVTVSTGVTLFPFHPDDDVDDVIREADTAMYQAKNLGRNQTAFYHADMQKRANRRLMMETELRTALEKEQFELYYQTQVDPRGDLRAVEALVRWRHPDKGILAPAEFIQVMEDTGMINAMGELVLEQACRQLSDWIAKGIFPADATLAVNVSAKQFRTNHISEYVKTTLRRYQVPPSRLVLEITESLLLPDDHVVHRELDHLAQLGVRLSVDDFGTGYSSLSVLQHAPIGQLKIDRRFINELDRYEPDTTLVRAIISMARALEMEVVAEGVETEGQHKALQDLGCDLLQGFLFSRPVPREELTRLLQELHSRSR
jgi:diguanylate cyclase (GGDEF)-like protein/PAS domain S-box-containing protein